MVSLPAVRSTEIPVRPDSGQRVVAQFDRHFSRPTEPPPPHLAAWRTTALPVRPNLDTIPMLLSV